MWCFLILPLLLASAFVHNPPVASSPGYIEASKQLKEAMNLSVDPCYDFYSFACGKWISNNPIPNDRSIYGVTAVINEKIIGEMKELYESTAISSSTAIGKVKNVYRACMDVEKINERGAKELLRSIEAIGRWPMLHKELWQADNLSLTDLLINASKERFMTVFLNFYVGTDMMNVSRRILSFDQDSLMLGSPAYYLDNQTFSDELAAYRTYIIATTKALSEDSGIDVNSTQIGAETDEIIEFETKLAEILVPGDQRRNFTELYNLRKFNRAVALMPAIDLDRLLRGIMPNSTHDYLDSNPDVTISEIGYFRRLSTLLESTHPRILTNYVMLRYISGWEMELGSKYDDINKEFYRVVYGIEEMPPRWENCLISANGLLSMASGSMYVRAHFDEESKNTTLSMIDDITEAFHEMLINDDWMDEDTKLMALTKAFAMSAQVGYPDFLLEDEQLDKYYESVNISSSMSYSQMIQNRIHSSTDQMFEALLEPVDRLTFTFNPAVVNAYYLFQRNAIIFPAAILQVPFFHPTYPKALNYGGIGAVIGHEITHGFDDQGSQFDQIGNVRDWWNSETFQNFSERAECLINQYSNITIPEIGLNINGITTLGENIADNGGIKQAYKAYKSYLEKNGEEQRIESFEQFDNDQMFFIGYSQTWCSHATEEFALVQQLRDSHSPDRYRVNVVLQNQPEFAAAFQCEAGSPMNPSHRCAVW